MVKASYLLSNLALVLIISTLLGLIKSDFSDRFSYYKNCRERAFQDLDISYACTIGLLLFLVILLLSIINLRLSENLGQLTEINIFISTAFCINIASDNVRSIGISCIFSYVFILKT
jgi:glyoxylate carboligase